MAVEEQLEDEKVPLVVVCMLHHMIKYASLYKNKSTGKYNLVSNKTDVLSIAEILMSRLAVE